MNNDYYSLNERTDFKNRFPIKERLSESQKDSMKTEDLCYEFLFLSTSFMSVFLCPVNQWSFFIDVIPSTKSDIILSTKSHVIPSTKSHVVLSTKSHVILSSQIDWNQWLYFSSSFLPVNRFSCTWDVHSLIMTSLLWASEKVWVSTKGLSIQKCIVTLGRQMLKAYRLTDACNDCYPYLLVLKHPLIWSCGDFLFEISISGVYSQRCYAFMLCIPNLGRPDNKTMNIHFPSRKCNW